MFITMKRLAGAVLLAVASQAVAADRISPETAAEITRKCGVADQLKDFAPSVRAGITTNPELASKLTEAQLANLLAAIDVAYRPAQIEIDFNAELAKALKPAAAKDTLVWLDSELGQRLTALENGATELASDPEKMAAAQQLMERLPPRRVERYLALMKATGADASGAQLVLNNSLGVAVGAGATLGARPPEVAKIRKELAVNLPQLTEAIGNSYMVMFASIYESVAEADLDQYVAFAESPSGKAYHQAVTKALDVALTNAATELGRQIGAGVGSGKGRAGA
ncbi:MAG: hypothetical protein NTW01_10540 [Gammaproteobacteria bacterium]|jgi:hypothetical protein|nr:hypothetical protein [Gammaproteobacteria bacterium]